MNILKIALPGLAAVYPLLGGGTDLSAKTAVALALAAGAAAWLAAELAAGTLPIPSKKTFAALAAAVFFGCAFWASPLRWFSQAGLKTAIFGLAFFSLSQFSERKHTETALRFSGWVLVSAALWQKFFLGAAEPSSLFINQNAFAGFLLMLLPLSLGRKRFFEAAVFLCALILTGARGAWISFSVCAAVWLLLCEGKKFKAAAAAAALCAGTAVYFMSFASLSARAVWWSAALNMIKESPVFGFGPGVFGFVYPAFHRPQPLGLSSFYAHSFPLELAAEAGIFCAVFFLGWVLLRIKEIKSPARWSILAALIMSLQDYCLSVPANFLIFCWLLSDGLEPQSPVKLKGAAFRGVAAIAALAAGLGICSAISQEWRAERKLLSAKSLAFAGQTETALLRLDAMSRKWPSNPNIPLLSAHIRQKISPPEAAQDYERALQLNPFRPASYDELAALYRSLGNRQLEAGALRRKASAMRW